MDEILLTVDEACRRLHLSKPTLYQLINRNEIQTITIGRARRISVDALAAFVEERQADAATARS